MSETWERVKYVKITGRIVLGTLATAGLASGILFALDAYHAGQPASTLTALSKASPGGTDLFTGLDDEDVKPSIGTKEQQIVYQTQEETGQPQLGSGQPLQDAGQEDAAGQAAAGMGIQGKGSGFGDAKDNEAADKETEAVDKETEASASVGKKRAKKNKESKKDCTFHEVTQDYFSDALFIGDSRTVGMQQSGLLADAAYYAKTGIGIGDFLSQRIVNEGGTMISVEEALGRHSFRKVYIMLGINDMSRGDEEWFAGQYMQILEAVRRTQPDAVIYIQGNIPMGYSTQDMSGALNNRNLKLRNEASRALADSEHIFYLDVDEVFMDGYGNLASMYTADGLHVRPRYYPLWVDYLVHHAIVW